jgi:hypothetical protein
MIPKMTHAVAGHTHTHKHMGTRRKLKSFYYMSQDKINYNIKTHVTNQNKQRNFFFLTKINKQY